MRKAIRTFRRWLARFIAPEGFIFKVLHRPTFDDTKAIYALADSMALLLPKGERDVIEKARALLARPATEKGGA